VDTSAVSSGVSRTPRIRASAIFGRRVLLLIGQLALLGAVLAVWEWIAAAELVPAAFIGRPTEIFPLFIDEWKSGDFVTGTRETMSATLIAFVIGGVAAILSALLLTAVPVLYDLSRPYITALNSLPRVALIPLFIIWFGLGPTSKIASGVSLMYFVLLYNTLAGATSVDPDHVQLARSLGIPKWKAFFSITLPTAVPAIFAGLRLGLIYTLLGVVTAELIAGGTGLGSMISYFSNTFNANGVFAVLLLLVILSSVLSTAMDRIEHRLVRWQS
jgi:NitT/TauT family transport system permease protein